MSAKFGLVSLPELVCPLRDAGYTVITGENFRSSAQAVRQEALTSGAFPVLVGDSSDTHPAAGSWLRTTAATAPVSVIVTDSGTGLDAEGLRSRIEAPANLGEALTQVGIDLPAESLYAYTITAAGGLQGSGQSVQAVGPAEPDPWGEPSPAPRPEPTPGERAAPAAAAPVAVAAVPWGGPTPAPAPVPVPAPVDSTGANDEEEFDFDTPSPAPALDTPSEPAAGTSQALPPPIPEIAPVPAPLSVDDLTATLAGATEPSAAFTGPTGNRHGKVVIVMGARGGVGKSTTALNLAQYAAEHGPDGFRVALVDANRGQGDLRTYLRIPTAPLPTVYDAARAQESARALATPEQVGSYREDRWGRVHFALAAAPPADVADPAVVTASVYADVIAHARTVADLVVVDTQIHEAYDTSQLWDKVMIPLLASGAWCLAITDTTTPGVRNLAQRLTSLAENHSITRDRILLAFNKVPDADQEAVEAMAPRMSSLGHFVGSIAFDEGIGAAFKAGRLTHDHDGYAPVLTTCLHAVTGLSQFDPARLQTPPPPSLLTKLLRWRKGA